VPVKNRADLIAKIVAQVTANGAQAITGPIVQSLLSDLADSGINILGDTAILGNLGYATLIPITTSGGLVYKDWVENQVVFKTQLWITEDNRPVIVTIDGNNEFKITDII
jgi:hypothetical protein